MHMIKKCIKTGDEHPKFWEKAPGQNWEKMIDLTSKFGEINDIEYNKGSKISSKSSYFKLYNVKHTI